MASLIQGASFLAERAGKQADMSFIREMKDLIVIKWARVVANTLSKNPNQDRYYKMRFKIKMRPVDLEDECDLDVKCYGIMRSVEEIPEAIKYSGGVFSYVGSIDGSTPYGWTTFANEPFLAERPLTGKMPRHTKINRYIYTVNSEVEELAVEMVPSDPRELAKFMTCNGDKPCYSDEQEFPIDNQNYEIILKDILTTELRMVVPNEKILIKEDQNA